MTKNGNEERISKFLSFVLRHKPEEIGLQLDEAGWADVEELIAKAAPRHAITRASLEEVVETNNKKRFEFSEDGFRIRARQGHSLDVDLGLEALVPPEVLYHGTASRFLEGILVEGLRKMSRHHVHLSGDNETAAQVGQRYGKLVLLDVGAGPMHRDGFQFYRSANGVWLVDRVPADYLSVRGT